MSRSVMLGKIRQALAQTEPGRLPTDVPEFPQYADPVGKFQQELEGCGGVFLDARTTDQLPILLATVIREVGVTEVYWEAEEIFGKHGIPFVLRNPKAFSDSFLVYSYHFRQELKLPLILSSKPYQRSELSRILISASSARFGIAETGTVVHAVRPGVGRSLSVLPPAHLVFLSEKDLLMNHVQLFRTLRLGEEGSALTLVTGPSRTADIEKTLVVGVHGPKQLFVIMTP